MSREFARRFYKSKLWQKVRALALNRDLYICQECGKPAEEVHHKIWLTPENINNPEIALNINNLVSLCRDCHFRTHRINKEQLEDSEFIFDESGMIWPADTPPID